MAKKSSGKQKDNLKIKKTLQQNLADLDDHLYLIRDGLKKFQKTPAHIKVLAAELRLLMCSQNWGKTEGLLWRMVGALNVSDEILLQVPGRLDLDDPLARGLRFYYFPVQYGSLGDSCIPPQMYSIENFIKTQEALYVINKTITHENVIKMVSEQNGTAHEDEGICFELDELKNILLNGEPSFISVIQKDAELALQIGERVLEEAEKRKLHHRLVKGSFGILSVFIRFSINAHITGSIPLLAFVSFISEVEIQCLIHPTSFSINIYKHERLLKEIVVGYPENYIHREDLSICFQYQSQLKKAHIILNGIRQDQGFDCDAGFICASELNLKMFAPSDLFSRQFAMCYERLLKPSQCMELLETSPDLAILYESKEVGPLDSVYCG